MEMIVMDMESADLEEDRRAREEIKRTLAIRVIHKPESETDIDFLRRRL